MSDKDCEEAMESRIQASRQQVIEASASTRIQARKEKVMQGKALARWMFGRFHLRVPRFTEQLFTMRHCHHHFLSHLIPRPTLLFKSENAYTVNIFMAICRKCRLILCIRYVQGRINVFIRAGLERYFDDAFGWATFLNVAKVSYFVGAVMAKGRVFAMKNRLDAQLVGHSTLWLLRESVQLLQMR
mmetsp:Transcript_26316/g.47526  ORF Transcript_26316/g.47526 Transcript_26316/m.47526 type:complete len:186 (+) Transcript_26316:2648-3205(+)